MRVYDRVVETTTTTGTGTVTLGGAASGFIAYSSVFADGETVFYQISDASTWEIGKGVFTLSGTTLSRVTVLASSNAGALVSFAAGTKTVRNVAPASYLGTGAGIMWGDGADGAALFDGSTAVTGATRSGSIYTLTRDCFWTSVLISTGVTVRPMGYRMYSQTTFVNPSGGLIECGATQVDATGGTGQASLAIATLHPAVLTASNGRSTNGNGSSATTNNNSGYGSAGGVGGTAGGSTSGAETNTLGIAGFRIAFPRWFGDQIPFGVDANANVRGVRVGARGGSGSSNGGGGTSGAAGNRGGNIYIACPLITNSGTITCRGGNGGNASGAGNNGGGGGGAAGMFVALCDNYFGNTPDVSGGTAGTSTGTASGSAAGSAGYVIIISNS